MARSMIPSVHPVRAARAPRPVLVKVPTMPDVMTRQMQRQFRRKAATSARTRMRGLMDRVDQMTDEERETLSAWLAKNPEIIVTRKMIPLILNGSI